MKHITQVAQSLPPQYVEFQTWRQILSLRPCLSSRSIGDMGQELSIVEARVYSLLFEVREV